MAERFFCAAAAQGDKSRPWTHLFVFKRPRDSSTRAEYFTLNELKLLREFLRGRGAKLYTWPLSGDGPLHPRETGWPATSAIGRYVWTFKDAGYSLPFDVAGFVFNSEYHCDEGLVLHG